MTLKALLKVWHSVLMDCCLSDEIGNNIYYSGRLHELKKKMNFPASDEEKEWFEREVSDIDINDNTVFISIK